MLTLIDFHQFHAATGPLTETGLDALYNETIHISAVSICSLCLRSIQPAGVGPGPHKRPTKAHFRDHVRSLWARSPELPDPDSKGSTRHLEL